MDRIEEFIKRRFQKDCDWTNGNCYFFALILHDRFADYDDGFIVYEPIAGHFMFKYDGKYYDWTGQVELTPAQKEAIVYWVEYRHMDEAHYARIVRDCIQ